MYLGATPTNTLRITGRPTLAARLRSSMGQARRDTAAVVRAIHAPIHRSVTYARTPVYQRPATLTSIRQQAVATPGTRLSLSQRFFNRVQRTMNPMND